MTYSFAGYTEAELQDIEDNSSHEELATTFAETFGPFDVQALKPEARRKFQRELCLKHIRKQTRARIEAERARQLLMAAE